VKTAPVDLAYGQVVLIILGTLALSMLVLTIPSIISRRINPSTAIRFK
jgi:ABC-type lipoprotein release transport system permease subunit